jgi:hypothetical protein
MGRITNYKIKRLPFGSGAVPGPVVNNPGTEATQMPPSCVVPKDIMLPPGQRIATTMEIRSQIADIMNRRDYHPIRELVEMVQATRQMRDETGKPLVDENGRPRMEHVYDAEFRKAIHAELAPYIAPKLKAVDMQIGQQGEISIQIVRFSDTRKNDPKQVNDRVVDV